MALPRSKKIFMKNEKLVQEKIKKLLEDGCNKLQIITDFDFTITKQHENGTPALSSFCIFKKSKQLPKSYLDHSNAELEKYRPIELDPSIPKSEKMLMLDDWMCGLQRRLKGIKFDRKELDKLAESYGHSLRDGTKELFEKLNAKNVPILIMSAGLGDMVKSLLNFHGVLRDNIHVVSNFLKFNGDSIQGFEDPDKPLHVLNKNKSKIDDQYFEILKGRTNVLLMGDSLGDADMSEGAKNVQNVLKIGFLYHHVEENLPMYQDTFDIVLIDDQTMNVVMEILHPIL